MCMEDKLWILQFKRYKIIQQKFKNPKMAKSGSAQNLPADVTQLIDQLDRHCLAPDGSLVTKSVYNDLQLAREEMFRESLRYLEAMAI
ncbi:putative HAUS augmin-like complex subunit 4 [Helianthus annuus]|nr:putative HAUS augmin-like complex subunit 4 [Helianthus annuus]KAJ0498142.1 putative HAUS augmin-like complex subunit 4 [Helianthus annuus]KAJ0664144.1 putative HAUS augmin-like complex subunit 4 [Helianthus annuus]KAJ0671627.1 putative HAUS augmin-like complex subunit 4 [Helianthus annuus]